MPRIRTHEISIEMHSLQTNPSNWGSKDERAVCPQGEDDALISFVIHIKSYSPSQKQRPRSDMYRM